MVMEKTKGTAKNMARCAFMVSENNYGLLQKKTMQCLLKSLRQNMSIAKT